MAIFHDPEFDPLLGADTEGRILTRFGRVARSAAASGASGLFDIPTNLRIPAVPPASPLRPHSRVRRRFNTQPQPEDAKRRGHERPGDASKVLREAIERTKIEAARARIAPVRGSS